MKVTIDLPETLYRQVKAKSALEGRPVRGVAEELFRGYVRNEHGVDRRESNRQSEPALPWFGMLRDRIRKGVDHDMEAIRDSIGRAVARDRDL